MSINIDKVIRVLKRLQENASLTELKADLKPDHRPIDHGLPKDNSTKSTIERTQILKQKGHDLPRLFSSNHQPDLEQLDGSIENFIGFTQIPTGVIGPLRVNGTAAKGDFYVPLATTEGALAASYHRGSKAVGLSGGVTSICLTEGVRRSPLFGFESIGDCVEFVTWITTVKSEFDKIVEQHTRHGKIADTTVNMEGNQVILTFEYHTGDASGQNMVTICTNALCNFIIENSPIKPKRWYVESNYSGDKKASALSFTTVRGKKVSAECVIPREVLKNVLKTTADSVENYWRSSTVSVIQSGSIGAQGHFANGLAALFLATGQDVACVAEAAVGLTRMERVNDGDLYVSVTLPNLIVGTVGGGTKFTTQQECLNLMGCAGAGKARTYAEICGALLLCGELSIASALAEGHFSTAHENLGRNHQPHPK